MKEPSITSTMVKYLEELFPIESPSLDDSEREIFFRSGQRSVVEKIKSDYELQQKRKKHGVL